MRENKKKTVHGLSTRLLDFIKCTFPRDRAHPRQEGLRFRETFHSVLNCLKIRYEIIHNVNHQRNYWSSTVRKFIANTLSRKVFGSFFKLKGWERCFLLPLPDCDNWWRLCTFWRFVISRLSATATNLERKDLRSVSMTLSAWAVYVFHGACLKDNFHIPVLKYIKSELCLFKYVTG